MTNDEWILVGQAKQGDAHAFARLYERYYHDLYRFAYCYMQQTEAAEDAVMNSIEKAYVRLGDLKKNSSFKSWLYQITANECRAQLRKMPIYMEDTNSPEPRYEESGYSTPKYGNCYPICQKQSVWLLHCPYSADTTAVKLPCFYISARAAYAPLRAVHCPVCAHR